MAEGKKSGGSPIGMVINVIVAIIFGALGWVFAPNIAAALPSSATASLSAQTLQIIIAVILFFLGLAISALLLALVMPKDSRAAREADMEREREKMRAAQKAARDRARREGRSGRR